ncbi:MAG: hypothetical protein C4B58_06655 [Deltaproteobacteria bacterium]|nr:MAG: hypothetical protein C4B58_06655 [Deltaproteobacteria bacterium]
MSVSIALSIRLGPLVHLEVTGESCTELAAALEGYEKLNSLMDTMCSDLAGRVYPEGMESESEESQEGKEVMG